MTSAPHPFTIRAFRFYFVGRLATTLGSLSMVIVIGWQVYDLARRAGMSIKEASFQLGLIGLAQFVPLLCLSLFAGWVADRVDRRRVAIAAIALEVVAAAALAWLTYSGHVSLAALFVVAALLGVGRAFAGPAVGALAPNIVPAPSLPTAIAVSSVSFQLGAVFGPAMGGYLYAMGPALPYTVSASLFALSVVMLSLIGPVPGANIAKGNPWRQMIDGLHYVRENRLVLGAISLDLFAVLLGGATAMLPIYARDILQTGASGLGHLRAAPAAGAVCTGLYLAWRPLRTNVGVKMLIAVSVFGVATVAFGLAGPLLGSSHGDDFAPSVLVSLAALAFLGAADALSVFVRQSLIQIYTPNSMRGRVGAVSTLFISASNELGEAESGFLAALIGPVVAVVAGGIGAVLVTAAWSRLFPELRRARTFDPPQTLEDPPVERPA